MWQCRRAPPWPADGSGRSAVQEHVADEGRRLGQQAASYALAGHLESRSQPRGGVQTLAANHGGGYAYRMAPADGPLTEKTFGKTPLDFVGDSILRWGGDRSTQLAFNSSERGWETDQGTVPVGSTWRKNPIPPGLWEREGPTFNPVCTESKACIDSYTLHQGGTEAYDLCKCSGLGEQLSTSLEVVDRVLVPKGATPGKYVLQWRWDCEESDQVWASCSDVTIVA